MGKRLTILIFCILLIFPSLSFAPKKVIVEYNLTNFEKHCEEIFGNQPIEILVYFTKKHCYQTTSLNAFYVDCNILWLEGELKKNGESISDIVLIIHNHLLPGGFSKDDGDIAVYRYFTNRGFKGLFCLWFNHQITRIWILQERN